MLANLIMTLANRSPQARGRIFKWTFEALTAMSRDVVSWTFMNYGYEDLEAEANPTRLDPRDEPERYCIQLYRHAAAPVDLSGKEVLEVSCGRGGGASYVKRCLDAKSVTGIDFSANQIDFCRRIHKEDGLRFLQGAAEDIPLPDECFDALVNIEASCLYQDRAKFFAEVFRVLRPGGHFIYADIHRAEEIDELLAQLEGAGLVIENWQDITKNVRQALDLDHGRRAVGLKQLAPFYLRGLLGTFAGLLGTRIPNGLAGGSLVYLSFVLSKTRSVGRNGKAKRFESERLSALV